MTYHFEPRAMLKHSSIPLLRQFFEKRGVLADLPWDEIKEKRLADLIYRAWQSLPDAERRTIQAIFQEVWDLADERGVQVFSDELKAIAPQRVWEFVACQSRLNRVLWFYINFPELFEKAALFVRADWLSSSRYAVRRNSLPKKSITVTPEIRGALAAALQNYYWPNEMRGRHCRIEHYTRSDGNEYFFAYLDNWPDSRLICEDNGEFESISLRDAFSLLFVFCPHDGSLELVVKGDNSIHYPLQRAFAQAVCGVDVEPANPIRPEYRLQQILDADFRYPTDATDQVASVRLRKIQLEPTTTSLAGALLTLSFTPRVQRHEWIDIIHRQIAALGLKRNEVKVRQAAFQLKFMNAGVGRAKSMTFTVNLPSACDLKTKSDDLQEIGVRCLQKWGILDE